MTETPEYELRRDLSEARAEYRLAVELGQAHQHQLATRIEKLREKLLASIIFPERPAR